MLGVGAYAPYNRRSPEIHRCDHAFFRLPFLRFSSVPRRGFVGYVATFFDPASSPLGLFFVWWIADDHCNGLLSLDAVGLGARFTNGCDHG